MLFKKNHKKKRLDAEDEEPLAILTRWKAFKQQLADSLQEKYELLSSQTKKFTLILFCVLFGGSSVAIIIHSLTTKAKPVKIASISRPAHANDDSQSTLQPDSIITKQEYNRVLQFENYMLALKTDSTGRKRFDSIIKNRPHLMDSISLFEKIYLSQTKK
jgi:hypothetical protein